MNGAPPDDVITFHDVGKTFGDTWVLEHMSFSLSPGTILGLIGPSGCGKTTTVRIANGFHRPDAGDVTIFGTAPTELDPVDRTRIGYLPQHPVLFDTLSLRENLNFHASLNGVRFSRKRRVADLLELVDLEDDERKLVSEASGGMKRRLALAGALVHGPDVLMLDEPTAGIDPILRRRFWEHFRMLRDSGTALVVSTQFVDEASNCDVVAMLAHGRVAALGSPGDLLHRARGGTLYDLQFDHVLRYDFVRRLREHASVSAVVHDAEDALSVTVSNDAPPIGELCESIEPGTRPAAASERPPDWDEVFIALVGDDASDDVATIADSRISEAAR
ncbi:MAG: ABC transporter ATP-binding protein [Ilumatobacter sp.]|uniref:ABC transporter ATP-binding protein n=1 Tax=Ilumatobacter sp. TaxID=1967498 RepID=UPI0032981979